MKKKPINQGTQHPRSTAKMAERKPNVCEPGCPWCAREAKFAQYARGMELVARACLLYGGVGLLGHAYFLNLATSPAPSWSATVAWLVGVGALSVLMALLPWRKK